MADGRQMYIKAPKGTITPASHGVVAVKHCVAIAHTAEIKFKLVTKHVRGPVVLWRLTEIQ